MSVRRETEDSDTGPDVNAMLVQCECAYKHPADEAMPTADPRYHDNSTQHTATISYLAASPPSCLPECYHDNSTQHTATISYLAASPPSCLPECYRTITTLRTSQGCQPCETKNREILWSQNYEKMSVRPPMSSLVALSSRLGRDKSVQSPRPVTLFWYLTTIGYNLESESFLPSVEQEHQLHLTVNCPLMLISWSL